MKKIAIITLSLLVCGIFFGGCRRNVGTATSEITTMPTTQSTTASTTEATHAPVIPMPTDVFPGETDESLDGPEDPMPGARRPVGHRPMPHG